MLARFTCIVAVSLALAPAAVSAGELAYVSNEWSGTISVIDTASDRVVATIATGGRPRGIRVDPRGHARIYVAVSRPRDAGADFHEGVAEIDTVQRRMIRRIPVGSDPEQFALAAEPPRLFVSNEDVGTASIVDLIKGELVATAVVGIEPEGVTISPDQRWVYVTGETSNTVSVIDTGKFEVVASFLVEARPRDAAFSADGKLAFVSAEVGRALSVVDVAQHHVIGTYRFSQPMQLPVGVAVDLPRVYVATGRGNTVAVLDARDPRHLRLEAEISVGQRPWGIALADGGAKLYTANGLSNDISVIDTHTLQVIRTIPAGERPWGIAIGTDPGGPP
ncbi:MAG TPA: hypothetical protein VEB21_11440 [Terriglobales bacterium]|nr:hypothetical protein [Terriglobales bacterium]